MSGRGTVVNNLIWGWGHITIEGEAGVWWAIAWLEVPRETGVFSWDTRRRVMVSQGLRSEEVKGTLGWVEWTHVNAREVKLMYESRIPSKGSYDNTTRVQ